MTLLGQSYGLIPAIGPILHPHTGIWSVSPSLFEGAPESKALDIPGLQGKVTVHVDQDQVKHIFAESDHDLYVAQGFVVASDRLWQMEFVTRLAAGRLSEVFGRRTLEVDRFFTKLGISEAAEESVQLMMMDSVTGPALRAYAEGVNAFIQSLTPKTLPFEYRILGHHPEEWTAEKAGLLLKYMTYNLAGRSLDMLLTRSRTRLNREDFEDLFSLSMPVIEPIIPKGRSWDFESRAGDPPDESMKTGSLFQNLLREEYINPHEANGSNNWAVTGKKSTTGYPILSNDIHLGYSLPTLWYEVQLVSPTQNVYGVSLPGAPGVVLGFNNRLAWGVTNGGTDVLDWYELRYRDDHKSEYLFDGQWRPVISREKKIKVRNHRPVKVITRQTHLGPLIYDEKEAPLSPLIPKGLAMRWAGHEPSNELKSFMLLNRARSTQECFEAISTFQSPAQNFLCADNKNDVGLWHMGLFPVRWRGQGRMILDGSESRYEWKGWIPKPEVPFIRNPGAGFVSSANQAPTDHSYPHYIGWPFEAPFRAMRINELLRSKPRFSPEDMIAMQADTLSVSARMALPALLKAMEGREFTASEQTALEELRRWDYRFPEDSAAAAIYYFWFKRFEKNLWFPHFEDPEEHMYPPLLRTITLLRDESQSKWFDNLATDQVETIQDIASISFREATEDLKKRSGSSQPARWLWADVRETTFEHLGKIPGLGKSRVRARGMEHSIFANTGVHGPVWKMVVALGPDKPRAWGIFPGGQSGNPLSPHYDDFIEKWAKAEMRELIYLKSPNEHNPRLENMWTLHGESLR